MSRFKTRALGAAAMIASIGLCAGAQPAAAQPVPTGCRPANSNAAVGDAVLGGVAGALLGSAVAGHHEKTAGAIVGGVGGAMVGGAIGSSQSQPCPQGYVYAAPPPPPPPPPGYGQPREGDFWYGAPPRIHDRIAWVRNQVLRIDQDGWLSPRERNRLLHRVDEIARQEDGFRYQDGGRLAPDHIAQLNQELDDLSHRLHWDEYTAEHHRDYRGDDR